MKLNCLSKLKIPFPVQIHHFNSRVLTSRFSTKNPSSSSSSSSSSDSLFHRIQIIRDPKASVLPVLQQWVTERRPLDADQLRSLVRIMKDFRRYNHALEIGQMLVVLLACIIAAMIELVTLRKLDEDKVDFSKLF